MEVLFLLLSTIPAMSHVPSALRRGTATVEAAVCLPVLMVLVFASIEAANAIFLKQTVTMAAYEGAVTGGRPDGQSASVIQRCQSVLQARDIQSFDVSVDPPSLSTDTPAGTPVAVTVTIPASEAAMGPLWLYQGRTVSHTVHMARTK